MSHDVFISYAARGKDKSVADAVCAELEKQKIRCWIAPRDVAVGQNFAGCIVEAIKSARVFVIVFSDNSNQSQQVLREVERAVNKGIPIVPFRIEEFTPTKDMEYFLSSTHWLDALTPPLEKHLNKLVNTVQNFLDEELPAAATVKREVTEQGKDDTGLQETDTVKASNPFWKNKRLIAVFSTVVLLIAVSMVFLLGNRFKELGIEDITTMALPSLAYIETSAGEHHSTMGSGFVVDPDGLIVTNYHLMVGSTSAVIEVNNQQYEDVRVWAFSKEWDLVILKIEANNLKPLALGRGFQYVSPGEQVVAYGNPLGMQRTVSSGIVSEVQRDLGMEFDLIQTTAAISEGSSGGPLLNMRGEVIGVTSLTMSEGQNINFAIPVDYVHSLYKGPGEIRALSEVFGPARYAWTRGEFAVVLDWEGDVNLDLEIWSEDFNYLVNASMLGESPDIIHGDQGEEWFAFKAYPETSISREHNLHRNFHRGRYLVSLYYHEPIDGPDVEATLTVHFPDGKQMHLTEELWFIPPYDQWFAVIIDVDKGTCKTLDFFYEGVLVALLEWDTPADLDLYVFDYLYEDIFTPFMFDRDVVDGRDGLEVFCFSFYQEYDFTSGLFDIGVLIEDFQGEPATRAILTLLYPDYSLDRYHRVLSPDPKGDYLWYVIELLDVETYEYNTPLDQILYY